MIGRKRSRHGLVDRLARAEPSAALGVEREVDHHDRVLLDDADQQDDADQRDDAELDVEQHQRQHRADPGRRQGRQDRDRVDVALVEHAEHDVDGEQRRADQDRLVGERLLKRLRGAREAAVDRSPARAELRHRRRRSPACASLSETPGFRLNEIVLATKRPWWLTASGVLPGRNARSPTAAPCLVRGADRGAGRGGAAAGIGERVGRLVARGVGRRSARRVARGAGAASPVCAETVPASALVAWVPLDRAAGGADEDLVERLRALPVLRRHLHHHVILVARRVDHRDLALAEGVVERVVDLLRRRCRAAPRSRGRSTRSVSRPFAAGRN